MKYTNVCRGNGKQEALRLILLQNVAPLLSHLSSLMYHININLLYTFKKKHCNSGKFDTFKNVTFRYICFQSHTDFR